MPALQPVDTWRSEPFQRELVEWVESVETASGPVRLEPFKTRGWAAVWQVRAADRLRWTKINCPSQAFESTLLGVLGELLPGRVPELLAAREDGLMLMADGGAVLRSLEGEHDAEAQLASWTRVVSEWAQVQVALVEHEQRLLDAGVTRVDPAATPDLVVEQAETYAALPPSDPRHLDEAARTRLAAGLAGVRESAEVVAALGLPLALNHNDLHSGNAFVGAPGEPLAFFDLADSLLTDPLQVLLIPLGGIADAHEFAPDDPRLWRVADALLEVWSDLASMRDLRAALPHSLRLARTARHLSWHRVMPFLTADELATWGEAPAYWLAAVADPVDL